MAAPYVDAPANPGSGDFKAVFCGNPIGQGDPLDRFAEPEGGWGTEGDIRKTTTWRNKFGGVTINLVGIDSPNFDFPQPNGQKRYKYMIGQSDVDWIKRSYGEDSHQFWSQIMGVRRAGLTARRVITKAMCEQFKAFDQVVWEGAPTTFVAGLDAAYGGVGGDRCVLSVLEFGKALDGKQVIKCYPPVMVPVAVSNPGQPEDQITLFCKRHCESIGIPPSNFFMDARGSLVSAMAKLWSDAVNVVEFGGVASQRPVSLDHFIFDREQNVRRLQRCDEHYSKFVTELWFSVRYAIESGQLKELPREVMEEGCQREWKIVRNDRLEVEPKADMKERTNRSPDLFDSLATALEGARRRGFMISKLANEAAMASSMNWFLELQEKRAKARTAFALNYAA